MQFQISAFAQRFSGRTGTRLLMDDLGEALANGGELRNLGGGNPAHIPAMEEILTRSLDRQLRDGSFARLSGSYDGPQGHQPFLRAIASLLKRQYGWPIGPENVVMTAGSQASFFMLFNMFSGDFNGVRKCIQIPMVPEYIGYADIALYPECVRARLPSIERLGEHLFKYRIDFSHFELAADVGAVCVSRPTNPTGNVLSRGELERLSSLARQRGVPLIVDNAYGVPFPNIVFTEAEPLFDEHIIYCMSLSKLGLPGLRTGIIVASAEVVDRIRSMNAVMNLASGSLGASLVTPLIESGEVLDLSRQVIQPYYHARAEQAHAWCDAAFAGLDYLVHKPEGAIFLWLWFPGLAVSAQELYLRLKRRKVLVIPGHFFFPGLDQEWRHANECIRISYAQSPAEVEAGIRVIAEEIRTISAEKPG